MLRKTLLAVLSIILGLSPIAIRTSRQANAQSATSSVSSKCGSDPSQVGCWQMEGNANDGSTYGHNALAAGSPAWSSGKFGQAIELNGTQHVYVADAADAHLNITTQVTLAAWVKPTVDGTQYLVKKGTYNDGSGYELTLATASGDSGAFFFRINDSASCRVDSKSLYSTYFNTWVHVAATYDRAQLHIYINGALDDSASANCTDSIIANSTMPLAIGAQSDSTGNFTGALDDVRVYNRALSPAEIISLYNNTTPAGFYCTDLQSQVATANTEHKPMSKVWQFEGKWWTVFPASAGVSSPGSWVWRLDGTAWTPIYKLSVDQITKADVKPAGSPAGSVVHVLLYKNSSADLASIQYDADTGTYGAWGMRGTLTSISTAGSGTATIDIDSTGRMWLATQRDIPTPSPGSREIIVYYSEYGEPPSAPYAAWIGPIVLATGTRFDDDISAVIALPNNTVGVMWSNQDPAIMNFGFKYHRDSDLPGVWTEETPKSQYGYVRTGGGFADNHLNLAVASDGTLYVAVKTSYHTMTDPQIALMVRRLTGDGGGGTWDDNIYPVSIYGTRPIISLDDSTGVITVIYTGDDVDADIVFSQSAIQPIEFGQFQVMRTGVNNNVSGTKLNSNGELVAIYSNGTTINGSQCIAVATGGVDLSITNTDQKIGVLPGEDSTYTIEVTNHSESLVMGITVVDNFPSALTVNDWTCAATGAGSSCTASGTGDIDDSISLAGGGKATYAVNVTIASGAAGMITNTATVSPPAAVLDPDLANNTSVDTTIVRTGAVMCGPDLGLVACYLFEDGSGSSFLDGMENGAYNDGQLVGAPSWSEAVLGMGISFNGTSQFGYASDENSLDIASELTISAWLQPKSAATQSLISKSSTGTVNGYELSLSSSTDPNLQKVYFRINQASNGDLYQVTSTTQYPTDGAWIHAAATFDGKTMRIYINGVQEGVLPAQGVSISQNDLPLAIGAQFDGSTAQRFYSGAMDDIRIYNRALKSSEIAALANRPPEQPASPFPSIGNQAAVLDPNSHVDLQVNANDLNSSDLLTVHFYGRPYTVRNFTLAVLPDTQNYAAGLLGANRAMFDDQTSWIVSNKSARNIVYVTHVGDIVNTASSLAEWDVVGKLGDPKGALTALDDAGIPYGLALGNHDGPPNDPANFNLYFPPTRVGNGHYGSDNDNNYGLFTVGDLQFIIIQLEYTSDLDPDVLAWADGLLQNNPSRRGIVVFHDLIDENSQLSPLGQTIYNSLGHNQNLFLMLGGHQTSEVQLALTDSGHTIYALRSDFQDRTGGNGWMRLMEFQPLDNRIQVSTFSPYLNEWENDADSSFALPYNMMLGLNSAFELIGTASDVSPGSLASVPWSGLAVGQSYQWYVTISDGVYTTTSSTLWFTASAPTSVRLLDFSATAAPPSAIQLSWSTAQEVDLLGFNVYGAASPDGARIMLNSALLPAFAPGQLSGNSYSFVDNFALPGQTYYYWVEWVGKGSTEVMGPANAFLDHYIWLPVGLK